MMKTALTIGGFVASAVLLAMAAIMICALNLVLNGYHRECGIWQNAVPFMCSPHKEQPKPPTIVRPAVVQKTVSKKPPTPIAQRQPVTAPKSAVQRSNCAPLQQEPYRVQCDRGICYHDLGYRANCGLADNWDGRR